VCVYTICAVCGADGLGVWRGRVVVVRARATATATALVAHRGWRVRDSRVLTYSHVDSTRHETHDTRRARRHVVFDSIHERRFHVDSAEIGCG
jgi:hypothetical protein